MIRVMYIPSPVGRLTLAAKDGALIGLWLEGQKYYMAGVGEELIETDDDPVLLRAADWLRRYFEGGAPSPSELPLAPEGTPFRKKVWKALAEIPYGAIVTYAALAEKIGCASARAVGGAVGHNPISIIIPCHRVIGSYASLTGYAGGIERKGYLLEHEKCK